MSNVHQIVHPLIQHKMAIVRNVETGPKEFRELVDEIALFMAYEVTRDIVLEDVDVETPMGLAKCQMIAGKKIGVIPILRAGLGMVNGMLRLIPAAKVGHIGVYRDPETLRPVEYYCKLPSDISERDLIVVDYAGTGALRWLLLLLGRGGKNINMVYHARSITACRLLIQCRHFRCCHDKKLESEGTLCQGWDAGDRLFGTKQDQENLGT